VLTAAATAGATGPVRRVAEPVRDEYIVVLKAGAAGGGRGFTGGPRVASVASDLARLHGALVERVFEHALQGFSARMTARRATPSLRTTMYSSRIRSATRRTGPSAPAVAAVVITART